MADSLKFYLITDLHHYAPSLGTSGKAYEKWNNKEQKCLAETGAIIDAAFSKLIADKDIDIVLIAGDLTSTGAMESHLDLLPKLQRLRDAGKQVYLITATHDFISSEMEPLRCEGDELLPATPTPRPKLRELYADFGWDRAVSEHKESFSYCVKLKKGFRLLCMNDDGTPERHGYTESQIEWMFSQIEEAKKNGDYIFVMNHHPCLPPNPIYPLFSKKDMLADYDEITTRLADSGVNLVFTGHTHMQNIAVKRTEKGNVFYDVNTSSLVGYPTAIRKVTIDGEKIDVRTEQIDDFDFDRNGLSVNDYLKNHFTFFLNDIISSTAYDIDHLADLAPSFSMTAETVYKLNVPLKIIGTLLNNRTVGAAAKYLGVSGKIDDRARGIVLKDLVLQIMINLYHGDEPFYPGTPEYGAMDAFMGRIKKLVRPFDKDGKIKGLLDAVLSSMYDAPPEDWNAVLPQK